MFEFESGSTESAKKNENINDWGDVRIFFLTGFGHLFFKVLKKAILILKNYFS